MISTTIHSLKIGFGIQFPTTPEGKTDFFLVGSSRSNEIWSGIFKKKLSYDISDLRSIRSNFYYLILNLKLNLKI